MRARVFAALLIGACVLLPRAEAGAAEPTAAPSPRPLPRAFSVEFEVRSGGIGVGRTRWSLTSEPPGSYRYESRTRSTGLLSVFRRRRIVERSEGRRRDRGIQPLAYRYDRTGGKADRHVRIDFDWDRGIASTTRAGRSRRLPVPAGALDKLSYLLAMMRDVAAGKEEFAYPVADAVKVKRYRFRRTGTERLATAFGSVDTVRIERVRDGGERRTTFWCAPRFGYLPVRIEHREKEGTVVRLEAVALEGFGEPAGNRVSRR